MLMGDEGIDQLFSNFWASCWNIGFQNPLSGPVETPTPIHTATCQQDPLTRPLTHFPL